MEGGLGTTRMGSRSSTRHGPASVFQGKVRRWRKSWAPVASPSPSASASRVLLYKWTPVALPNHACHCREGDGPIFVGVSHKVTTALWLVDWPRLSFPMTSVRKSRLQRSQHPQNVCGSCLDFFSVVTISQFIWTWSENTWLEFLVSVVLEQRKEEEARKAEEAEATSAARAEASTDQNAMDTLDGAISTEPLKDSSLDANLEAERAGEPTTGSIDEGQHGLETGDNVRPDEGQASTEGLVASLEADSNAPLEPRSPLMDVDQS